MASSPESAPSLLDDVLTKLSTLPCRRRLTATILVSQPRKKAAATVFPYAPKIEDVQVAAQEDLLLVAKSKDTQQTQSRPQSNTVAPNPGAHVAVTETHLYIFPTTHAVSVYISKVDTAGQGKPLSHTRVATVALLEHIVQR